MDSKLTSLLTVVAVILTASVAAYIEIGWAVTAELVLISVLALIGWLKFSFRETPSQNRIVAPYILVTVSVLALDACRYWSHYPAFIASTNWHSFLAASFKLTPVSWFLIFVTVPVSLLLLGGYYLSRRTPLGFYFAWWAFGYGLAESIIQFNVEFGFAAGTYDSHLHIAAWVAMLLFLLSVSGCQRLIKERSQSASIETRASQSSSRQVNLWTILFISLAAVYGIAMYLQAGILPVGVIVGSMMGGLIGWRKTTARHPADPLKVVPLYLLLQCLFFIHVGEETLTSFNQGIASITGKPWSDTDFTFLIGLIGPAVWAFGAYSLWRRQAFGNFILWFMIVGMILGEPTHLLVFPVVAMYKFGVGYRYFSGMYTALFPMIPAILALTVILAGHRLRLRREAES